MWVNYPSRRESGAPQRPWCSSFAPRTGRNAREVLDLHLGSLNLEPNQFKNQDISLEAANLQQIILTFSSTGFNFTTICQSYISFSVFCMAHFISYNFIYSLFSQDGPGAIQDLLLQRVLVETAAQWVSPKKQNHSEQNTTSTWTGSLSWESVWPLDECVFAGLTASWT